MAKLDILALIGFKFKGKISGCLISKSRLPGYAESGYFFKKENWSISKTVSDHVFHVFTQRVLWFTELEVTTAVRCTDWIKIAGKLNCCLISLSLLKQNIGTFVK